MSDPIHHRLRHLHAAQDPRLTERHLQWRRHVAESRRVRRRPVPPTAPAPAPTESHTTIPFPSRPAPPAPDGPDAA